MRKTLKSQCLWWQLEAHAILVVQLGLISRSWGDLNGDFVSPNHSPSQLFVFLHFLTMAVFWFCCRCWSDSIVILLLVFLMGVVLFLFLWFCCNFSVSSDCLWSGFCCWHYKDVLLVLVTDLVRLSSVFAHDGLLGIYLLGSFTMLRLWWFSCFFCFFSRFFFAGKTRLILFCLSRFVVGVVSCWYGVSCLCCSNK